jgi:hypothetical protein
MTMGTPKMQEIAKAIQEGASAYHASPVQDHRGHPGSPRCHRVPHVDGIKKPDAPEALSFAQAGTWRTVSFILGCLASGATGLIG